MGEPAVERVPAHVSIAGELQAVPSACRPNKSSFTYTDGPVRRGERGDFSALATESVKPEEIPPVGDEILDTYQPSIALAQTVAAIEREQRGRGPRHPSHEAPTERRSADLGGCRDDHRDDATGLLLVLGELRNARGLRAEEALAFFAGRLTGNHLDRVGPDLDPDIGIGLETVVLTGK